MSVIGELNDLLNKIPIWKELTGLPARMKGLEARVAELENQLKAKPTADACPICGTGALKVIAVGDHPTLGAVGVQERTLRCDNASCAHMERRMHDPTGITSRRR